MLKPAGEGFDFPLERSDAGRLTSACKEKLIAHLQTFAGPRAHTRRQPAFCAIGARGVSVRRVTLPQCPNEELQRLLELQIEKEFPLPPDQLAWGFRPVGLTASSSGNRPGQEVLVVALKREIVSEYSEVLQAGGFEPVFTPAVFARNLMCPKSAEPYGVLDVGRSQSELVAFENSIATTVRTLNWGSDQILGALDKNFGFRSAEIDGCVTTVNERIQHGGELARKIGDAIREELVALTEAIRSCWDGRRLYLTGGIVRLKPFSAGLSHALGGETKCDSIEVLAAPGHSAATLGLRNCRGQNGEALPLLSEPRAGPQHGTVEQSRVWTWGMRIALLLAASLLLRYAGAWIQKPRLERRLAEIKSQRTALPNIDRQLAFLQYLDETRPPYLDALFVLSESAPPGTRIESLGMNRRGEISLRGSMRDAQQALDFRSKLIGSGFFASVVLDEQTPTQDRQKLNFRMTAQWKPASARPPIPDRENVRATLPPRPANTNPPPSRIRDGESTNAQ